MRPGYALAQQIKSLDFPASHAREMRAVFLAQTLAYYVPLDPKLSYSEHLEEHEDTFVSILNAVNETIAVDTRLARSFFNRMIQGRLEVLMGIGDTTLAQHILTSDSQMANLPPDVAQTTRSYAGQPGFKTAHAAVHGILSDVFADD